MKRFAIILGLLLLVVCCLSAVYLLRNRPNQANNDDPQRDTVVTTDVNNTTDHRPTLDERAESDEGPGLISIVSKNRTFAIERDYNQRVEIEVANQGDAAKTIVCSVDPWGHGLLGEFVGASSAEQPCELQPGSSRKLSLYLFAQDAQRNVYRSTMRVKDAQSNEELVSAAITVLVHQPKFNLVTEVGTMEPGTLATLVTVTNQGDTLTDFSVDVDDALAGRVAFEPTVDHAELKAGSQLTFRVMPRLFPGFKGVAGNLVLRGAGNETTRAIDFTLPDGQSVFVASSFSTPSYSAESGYCTNCPSNTTTTGGWDTSGFPHIEVYHPYHPDNPLPGWSTVVVVEDLPVFGDVPIWGEVWSSPDDSFIDKFLNGTILPSKPGAKRGPRGLIVRPAYGAYRPEIIDDNLPEAFVAYSSTNRAVMRTWHSTRRTGKAGREVLCQIWHGNESVSKTIAMNAAGTFGQWPTVVALPDERAMVIWEQADVRDHLPSLYYRISSSEYRDWSEPHVVPGTRDGKGHYDPIAVARPDGKVTLVWQRSEGMNAEVMITHQSNDGGFAESTVVSGLPAGASRPIIALDGETLHMVFQAGEPSSVYYCASDDANTFTEPVRLSGAGESAGEPDLQVMGDRVHVVFRSGEDWRTQIMHTTLSDSNWSTPTPISPTDEFAEYATLSFDEQNNPVVEWYGYTRPTNPEKQAKSMLQRFQQTWKDNAWSQPQRILTRFPAAEAAWLQVNFELRTRRSAFRPHDVKVSLNGHEILAGKHVVPEGTYFVPFPPDLVKVDKNGSPQNVIGIETEHMNRGHYWSAAKFKLQSRHRFVERYVTAETQQAADAFLRAESETLNHSRADVALFASWDNEPLSPLKTGELITLKLVAANIGEHHAENVRVEVYDSTSGEPIADPLLIEQLDEMEFRDIKVSFPHTGKDRYRVVVRADSDDFDLDNNEHIFSVSAPEPPITPPLKANPDQLVSVLATDDPAAIYRVRFLEKAADKEVARLDRGQLFGVLPTGNYRLAVTRYQFEGHEVVFPDPIEHIEDQPLHVELQSGIELVLSDSALLPYRWMALRTDQPATRDAADSVQWHSAHHPVMLLPAGEYVIGIDPGKSEHDAGLFVSQKVVVKAGELTTLRLDNGLRIKPDEEIYSWRVYQGDREVQSQRGYLSDMILTPGDYSVAIQRTGSEHSSALIDWTQNVTVEPGKFTEVTIDSGIQISFSDRLQLGYRRRTLTDWVDDPVWGWRVTSADDPNRVLQFHGGSMSTMLLPPGDYHVAVRPTSSEHTSGWLNWLPKISVQAGEYSRVRLGSGVQLSLGDMQICSWSAKRIDDGQPTTQMQSQYGALRSMLLPPGEYQLSFRQLNSEHRGGTVTWPEPVSVSPDRWSEVSLSGGIQLELPNDATFAGSWEVVDPRNAERRLQWLRSDQRTMLLPPGEYQVALVSSTLNNRVPMLWPDLVQVADGKISSVKFTSAIRFDTVKGKVLAIQVVDRVRNTPVMIVARNWSPRPLPPGEYRVEYRVERDSRWYPLEEFTLTENEVKEIQWDDSKP